MKQLTDKESKEVQVVDTEVAVSIAERQVTELDTIHAMMRSGNVVVGEHYLRDLETIGIYARRGTLKIQRGRAMVNQRRMEVVLEDAAAKLQAVKLKSDKDTKAAKGETLMTARDYSTLLQSFAQLSSKLTESQQFSVDAEEVYRPAASPQDPDQKQNSFTPGAVVRPAGNQIIAENVHIHGSKNEVST